MIVQELIDKLNSIPNKDKEISCKNLWVDVNYEIVDVSIDEDEDPIITLE